MTNRPNLYRSSHDAVADGATRLGPMSDVPLVTVLVPARNEEVDIATCLRAILAQDHPHDRMEIVVVDGGSLDHTADRARAVLAAGDIDWRLVDNTAGTTPSNLNVGLGIASGDVICRIDARSIIPPEYVRLCVELLESRPDVAVTGGAQIAVPLDETSRSIGVARALNNRFVMGGSRYRAGAGSGSADTVYLGAFRTDRLRAAGGWDEVMLTNQDYELNRRLGRDGLVWFDARLRVDYRPRRTMGDLWSQYHRFGCWKVRYWRHSGDRPQARQWGRLLIALSGLSAILAVLGWPGNRRRRVLGFAAFGIGTLLAVDHAGAETPEAHRPADRLYAMAAMCVIGTGWVLGVGHEFLVGRGLIHSQR